MISLSLGARIDAKRRSRGKPGGADDTGGKRAPSLIAPPGLEGSGRIGETLSLLPGRWEGLPVPVLSVRWQRDGRDIPGATGFAYVPVPQDDGAEIAARVIADNTAGTASAASPARRVVWPAPEARAPIADQFLNPDSGEHVLNVSSNFEGGALRFSVTGEGVSIDPETGILSIATDALRDGISVTVTAVNSGGAVTQTFRLDVALPEIALPVAPEMVVAPVLPEVAAIGSKISVEAGTWSGTPVPELTYQWLLDGVEIAGAVEVSYLPLASEDGNLLACRVTASNSAGTAQAVSSAAEVRHATPLAAGGLADLLLDAGSGPVTVAAGAEFSGENLVFSVTGAGVEIDSTTGLVTISTDDLRTEEAITVTAGNSGGSATSSFRVTVRPVAPVLRVAPSLDGTGVIGAPVAVEPGLWDGAPEPALSFRWICGGDVVAGATEAAYVPGLAEDGKGLVCEVTATNEGGSEIARTPALALVLPAPVVAGTLADVSAEQGTPALELDAAAAFSGDGLVFAVAGDGAGIDAGTGLLTIATDAVREAAEVVVTASNSGGSAEIRFRVAITEKAFVPVPPLMLAGPVLVGSAKVGTAMTVETGSWGGDPAPGIACQWLRDGAPIEGAVGTDYLATAEDDLAEVACRVTATNSGGSAEALTAALTVTHVAPVAKGELFEEILDEGTGPQEVPTAQDFEGQNLAFDVAGAGATIDTATGVVSIPTDTPVDGATVTVTATNSGGAAESSFLVTVEAAEPEEPVGPPPPLADDQWQILRSEPSPEIAADSFRPVIAIDASIPVEAAQWTTSGQKPALPEHWETLAPAGEPYTFTTEMLNKDAGDWHVFAEPQGRRADFRIRYRLVADGAWSEESPVKQVPVPAISEPKLDRASPTSWHHVAHRTAIGQPGSFAMQYIHGADRSRVNPNNAFLGQDVTQGWLTEDGGVSWTHIPAKGLTWRRMAGVCWDPVLEDRFFVITAHKSFSSNNAIWMTDNKGDSFTKVLSKDGATSNVLTAIIPGTSRDLDIGTGRGFNRHIRVLMFFDPDDSSLAYFVNPYDRLYRSDDGGLSWKASTASKFGPNPNVNGEMGRIFMGAIAPGDSNVCLLACEGGLYRSTNIKADTPTFSKIGTGYPNVLTTGVPITAGDWVTGLHLDTASGKAAISIYGRGIYETRNILAANPTFTRTLDDSRTAQIWGHPTNYNHASVTRMRTTGNAALYNVLETTTGMSGFSVADAARISANNGEAGYIGLPGLMDRSLGMEGPGWQQAISVQAPQAGLYSERSMRAWIGYNVSDPADRIATANAAAYIRKADGWYNGSFGFDSLAAGHANSGGGLTGHMGFHPTDPLDIVVAYIDEGLHHTTNGFHTVENIGTDAGWTSKGGTYLVYRCPSSPNRIAYTVGDYSKRTAVVLKNLSTGAHSSHAPEAHGNHTWVGGNPDDWQTVYTSHSRTTNGGTSWQAWSSLGGGFPSGGQVMCQSKAGGTLYATKMAAGGIWRCTNPTAASPTWTEITASGTAMQALEGYAHTFIAGVEIDPSDANIIYMMRNAGQVWKMTIRGKSYSMARIDGGTNLPEGCECIAVDNYARTLNSPVEILYAMRGGFETQTGGNGATSYVWRKIGAENWEDISFDLPRTCANLGIWVHPLTGDVGIGGTAGTRWLPRPSSVYGSINGSGGINPSLFSSAAANKGLWLAADGRAMLGI
jgi:hypothetical protein